MELEELKKSWNALDEHLKDKELIKEEELGKLIGHADKGIHAIARLNIKLILISLPVLVLFLLEVLLHGRLNPIYIVDSRTILGHHHHPFSTTDESGRNASDRSDQPCQPYPSVDDPGTSDCHCFPPYTGGTLIYLLADMAIWDSHHSIFYPALGSWPGADLVDLSQEIPEPYSGNQEEPGRT
jgi:hypothetical protein